MRFYCIKILVLELLLGAFHSGFSQYNLVETGHLNYPDTVEMSGCWGYTDEDGNEYALIGTSHGTSIVDISEPSSPAELFFIEGGISTWREAKVWNHHAYISTEAWDEGMLIIDLNDLPASIDTFWFHGDDVHPFKTAHTLFIDENGILYLFGYNILTGTNEGAYMADLNPDPKNPVFVGSYNNFYIHDGFVRNDTLWAAEIYEGKVEVVDVSDKSSPVLMGTQTSGSMATHNCWLSDDGNYLFTTDEITWGKIESYDVTDLTDIKKLDAIKHGHKDSTVAHNTYYLNGYIITAHYSEGVTIHDVHKPDNMVEVGHYDTSPFGPYYAYEGVWGVYPYFSSGNIVATDRTEGVFILTPDYKRASYLEGTVMDEVSLTGIYNSKIELLSTPVKDSTNVLGEFKTGYSEEGIFDVVISSSGCVTKTISGVELISGETTILNAELECGTISVEDDALLEAVEIFYSLRDGMIYFSISGNSDSPYAIQIYNSIGQLMRGISHPAGNFMINANDFPVGSYFISVVNEDARIVKTIVVTGF